MALKWLVVAKEKFYKRHLELLGEVENEMKGWSNLIHKNNVNNQHVVL